MYYNSLRVERDRVRGVGQQPVVYQNGYGVQSKGQQQQRVVKVAERNVEMNPFGQQISRTPVKQNNQHRENTVSTLTIKSNKHKQYFEKPELRIIKPINSLGRMGEGRNEAGFYNSSETQSTRSQHSQLTFIS